MKKRDFASLFEPVAFCTACWFAYSENFPKAVFWMMIAVWCAVSQIQTEVNVKAYLISPEEFQKMQEKDKGEN